MTGDALGRITSSPRSGGLPLKLIEDAYRTASSPHAGVCARETTERTPPNRWTGTSDRSVAPGPGPAPCTGFLARVPKLARNGPQLTTASG
ncbi:hypothetical protein ACWGKF_39695, partial [Streptomyces chartreusis]